MIKKAEKEGKFTTVPERKKEMGYRINGSMCGNCEQFTYTEEVNVYKCIVWKNKRCPLGGFATTVSK